MVPTCIVEQLHKDKECGKWFKWTFMILVEVALINTPPDGNVRPKILDYIFDVDNIKSYNWCRYMISELLTTHKSWIKNLDKIFAGPRAFVVACYVDRVVHYKKMVNRCYPTVKGWTTGLLRKREKEELKMEDFGLGHVYDRYRIIPHEEDEEDIAAECDDGELNLNNKREDDRERQTIPRGHDEVGPSTSTATRDFLQEMMLGAKAVASSMSNMVKILQRAPEHVRDYMGTMTQEGDEHVIDTTRKAMGLTREGDGQVIDNVGTMTQAMFNDEFDDDEWVDIIVALTKAVEDKYILANRNEFPTFTLIPEWDCLQNDNVGSIPHVEKENLNQEKDKEKETEKEPETDKEAEKVIWISMQLIHVIPKDCPIVLDLQLTPNKMWI